MCVCKGRGGATEYRKCKRIFLHLKSKTWKTCFQLHLLGDSWTAKSVCLATLIYDKNRLEQRVTRGSHEEWDGTEKVGKPATETQTHWCDPPGVKSVSISPGLFLLDTGIKPLKKPHWQGSALLLWTGTHANGFRSLHYNHARQWCLSTAGNSCTAQELKSNCVHWVWKQTKGAWKCFSSWPPKWKLLLLWWKVDKKMNKEGLPVLVSGWVCLAIRGPEVWSLVRQLRFHMPPEQLSPGTVVLKPQLRVHNATTTSQDSRRLCVPQQKARCSQINK